MKKNISILGSTGSIGLSTFRIIDKKKKDFNINLLSANKNYKLIIKQIKKYKPKIFIINDISIYLKVKKNNFKKTTILNKFDKLKLITKNDLTISAIPGIAGLEPTIKLIKFTKKLCIANKESVVCGWDIINRIAKKNRTKIIPLDSEHFAISKLLSKYKLAEVKKIYITASGGPFLNYSISDFKKITPSQALKHPKWKMGKKISVDSSTLMNKILELVEAQKLFKIPEKKLDIIIHPNSLVHAIIELNNGLSEFIYHETSMIIPIANAIYEGNLRIEDFYQNKSFPNENKLIFLKVNQKIFPIIKLKKLINKYSSSSIIVNASNEILVEQFLRGKIPFLGISRIIMSVLKDRNYKKNAIKRAKNLGQIIKLDNWAKEITFSKIKKFYA